MSFQGKVGVRITGLNELNASIAAIQRESQQTKMTIHRDASTFFVMRAKEKVHKISGNLARSISVESITAQQAIISAKMPYAKAEEERPGKRRTPPNDSHAYMSVAAQQTSFQMPRLIKKGYDQLLARHKTR